MKRCKTHLVCVCGFLLAAVSAYGQRVNMGVDVGESSDRFGAQPAVTGLQFNLNAQGTVLEGNQRKGTPNVIAGGEAILPTDTANHAKEYAVYGGLRWKTGNLTFGFDGQIRKIILPTAFIDNQYFNRDSMELLEIPGTLKYNFGSNKRAFVQVQGAPEFGPRLHAPSSSVLFGNSVLYNPNFDHGYFVRASAGYSFGKWYARVTAQTRYFKFHENANNPSDLYNWKSNSLTGGVGVTF